MGIQYWKLKEIENTGKTGRRKKSSLRKLQKEIWEKLKGG